MAEILSRALVAGLILAGGAGLYWLGNRVIIARARGRRLGLEAIRPGIPAILYFTTPSCAPCMTVQRPALLRLVESLAEQIQVIEVDASAQPHLADYWGVLSVPTTFIIDSQGRPRRVNHGVAGAEKLSRQLEEVEQSQGSSLEQSIRRTAGRLLDYLKKDHQSYERK
ncbi:MAG TPA: thioredoxin family protein [Anaerolineales bacterium]|nr:thioredoxin family protein [Anaerolineales bacterium]